MRYLLDTNVCVDYLTGRYPPVVARIQEASPEALGLSPIAVAELRYGAEKSVQPERNHSLLDLLVSEIGCLPFDADAARAYGQIRTSLEAAGQPIGPNDMLIAAHAVAAGLVLVTDNVGEFSRVEGLEIENWREG